uniref:Uncharacterized protein n=1 Tax=Myotis myotis TaxID=51298 RepID=A0A7J7SRI2_MYOMY|nr:hypothetical protein mMyoMyo1_009424 [Myotis myotis]
MNLVWNSGSRVVGLESAGPGANPALWPGLLFVFPLFVRNSPFFPRWSLLGLQEMFQLLKENTFLNDCDHGPASVIIPVLHSPSLQPWPCPGTNEGPSAPGHPARVLDVLGPSAVCWIWEDISLVCYLWFFLEHNSSSLIK